MSISLGLHFQIADERIAHRFKHILGHGFPEFRILESGEHFLARIIHSYDAQLDDEDGRGRPNRSTSAQRQGEAQRYP